MVCSKCQKLLKNTNLATPGVKLKNEIYLGSPASHAADKNKSTTTTNNGISKNKLLSAAAKNPYAAYASSCETCKTKTERGRKYCQRCAYKRNACAMCGKSANATGSKTGEVQVQGQKFSSK